jgi:TolA-binding protein
MKSIGKLLIVAMLGIMVFSCTTKKTEQEYYSIAKNAYAKEDFKAAVDGFKELIKMYPKGKHTAEATFMLGFINANNLKNYDEAEKYYKEFIAKYPDNQLKDDAEYELKYLGKDLNSLPMFGAASEDSTK